MELDDTSGNGTRHRLVVDDAIVVLENVDRHIKEGESPFRAAIIGTREIAVPVIAMTLTLGAVYAPIALMGGITGSLFKEFALTLAGAVFVSGIIALTLSPMMCSKMLKANEEPSKFEQKVHHVLDGMTNRYEKMLTAVMAHRPVIMLSQSSCSQRYQFCLSSFQVSWLLQKIKA